jgi:hypothetical protein
MSAEHFQFEASLIACIAGAAIAPFSCTGDALAAAKMALAAARFERHTSFGPEPPPAAVRLTKPPLISLFGSKEIVR